MFHFAQHDFDPVTGELEGPNGSTRLQPKPARLLAKLLEARGELVERDDIRAELWPDTNVDFDAGLNTCVRQIRAALTDTGGEADWIETLPKRGYRIAVPVERTTPLEQPIADAAGSSAAAGAPDRGEAAAGAPDRGDLRRKAVPYVVTFLLLAAGTAATLWSELFVTAETASSRAASPGATTAGDEDPGPATEAPLRLAVLPFVDPEADDPGALNRSLTEAWVTALVAAAPGEIAVVGPATTAPLSTPDATVPQIAAAVDADFVLHGGHRASDSTFFVQVVHPDGAHLFARRFELPADSPAEAPPDLIAAITAALREARSP